MNGESINKNHILLIYPPNGWSNDGLINEGYKLSFPYYGNKMPFRLLREIHFYMGLKRSDIWYNKLNTHCPKYIFVNAGLIRPEYVRWLKKKNPKSIIMIQYTNPVQPKRYDPRDIPDDICTKWSGDKSDCMKYGLNYVPYGGYLKSWKVKKEKIAFDVFYVGKDKGRMQKILTYQKMFERKGLTTHFHIVAEHQYSIRRKAYKKFMPYQEVLVNLGKCRAILHLKDNCQHGITIRIMESLIHEIKLISDDEELIDYDFYDPNNIFILGRDDQDKLKAFVNSPYKKCDSIFRNHAYIEDGLKYMIEHV